MEESSTRALKQHLRKCTADLARDPRNPDILGRMAEVLSKLGRVFEAASCYCNAAALLRDAGHHDDAASMCARALSLDPKHARALEILRSVEDVRERSEVSVPAPSVPPVAGALETLRGTGPAQDDRTRRVSGEGQVVVAPGGVGKLTFSGDVVPLDGSTEETAVLGALAGQEHDLESDLAQTVVREPGAGQDGAAAVIDDDAAAADDDDWNPLAHITLEVEEQDVLDARPASEDGSSDPELAGQAAARGRVAFRAAGWSHGEAAAGEGDAGYPGRAAQDVPPAEPGSRLDFSELADPPREGGAGGEEAEAGEINLQQTVIELRSTVEPGVRSVRVATPVEDADGSVPRAIPPTPTVPTDLFPRWFLEQGEPLVVAAGDVLLKEHEKSNDFYILQSGRMDVVKGIRTGPGEERLIHMGTLEGGVCFGELALLGDGVRHASVRAMEKSALLRFTKAQVKELIARSPELNRRLRKLYRDRLVSWILHYSPLLRMLGPDRARAVLRLCKPRGLAADRVVMKQGSFAKGLYIVLLGMLDVSYSQQDGWETILLHRLTDGDFFGGISLMLDRPSPATVATRTFTQLLFLAKEDLFQLGIEMPELLKALDAEARRRDAGYEAILEGEAQYEVGTTVYLLEKKK